MPAEIRVPSDAERDDIARLLATSLNFPVAAAMDVKHTFPLDDMRTAYVDGQPVANAAEFRFTQWFGGRGLATSGIWGVVTEPEHRGLGLASRCVGALNDDARRRGDALTSLFPAVIDPYRKAGYELAGTYDVATSHRTSASRWPTRSEMATRSGPPTDAGRDGAMASSSRARSSGATAS